MKKIIEHSEPSPHVKPHEVHDMTSGYREIVQLEEKFKTPFYIFSPTQFRRNLDQFRSAFEQRLGCQILVGYSFKTNYIPYACRLAGELGACAEVVSSLEIELARRTGFGPERTIYNGPIKPKAELAAALKSGMITNLDNFQELEWVTAQAQKYPQREFKVGLRVNISLIDEAGTSHLQEGLAAGRFGFGADVLAVVAQMVRQLPNLHVNALHGHVSSTSRSLWVYRTVARTLAEAGESYFPETVDYLNVGGGFFGRRVPEMGLTDTPTYEDYAKAICDELLNHRWAFTRKPTLIIEPGMAVIADTMSFVTRVFEVKKVGDRRLAVVDGNFFNVKPTMHRRNHPFRVISQNDASGGPKKKYSVVGSTCMEKDCLLEDIECPEIRRGDYIEIGNVGAYTIVLTPPFIQPAPAILAHTDEGFTVIRRRQEFDDFFRCYSFAESEEKLWSTSFSPALGAGIT